MVVVELLALSATTLAVVGVVPQTCRLRSTGDAAGVSLVSSMFGVASESGWTVYALRSELWSVAPEAILMVMAHLVLARAIIRTGAAVTWALAVASAWTFGLVAIVMLAGWATLGALLGLVYAVQVTPAIWSAYHAAVPSGIAPCYWLANLFEGALWAVYGTIKGDEAVVLFAAVAIAGSVAILARWSWCAAGRWHHYSARPSATA